jgi:hypothetical protein
MEQKQLAVDLRKLSVVVLISQLFDVHELGLTVNYYYQLNDKLNLLVNCTVLNVEKLNCV